MRIISGEFRGRNILVPKGFKARPTTDFAKESLFNILMNLVDFESIKVLDLFAGTGSISYEFLSRGCCDLMAVEKSAKTVEFIRKTFKQLAPGKALIKKGDALNYIQSTTESFDLIFADPPYDLDYLALIPDKVIKSDVLKQDGIFVLEHGKNHLFEEHPNFTQHRKYGAVNFSFFGNL